MSQEIKRGANIDITLTELIEAQIALLPEISVRPRSKPKSMAIRKPNAKGGKRSRKNIIAVSCGAVLLLLLLVAVPLITLIRTPGISSVGARPNSVDPTMTIPNVVTRFTEQLRTTMLTPPSAEITKAKRTTHSTYPRERQGLFKLYQNISITSVAVTAFEDSNEVILFFAHQRNSRGYYSVKSPIFRLNPRNMKFSQYSTLKTFGVTDVEQFTIDGERYLAIANGHNDTHSEIDSIIYKYNKNAITERGNAPVTVVQKIRTKHIVNIHFFSHRNRKFLLTYENIKNGVVSIYEWKKSHFVKADINVQIPRYSNGCTTVSIATDTYFICGKANHKRGVNTIFKWTGSTFKKFQTFHSIRTRKMYSFEANGSVFLVASDSGDKTPIYRWNGTRFVLHQNISEVMGVGGRVFVIDGDRQSYLAVPINMNDNWAVYKLENNGLFKMHQKITMNESVDDLYSFKHMQELYIVAANNYGNSAVYKWVYS